MASKKKSTPQLVDPDAPLAVNTSNGETFLSITPESDVVPAHREVKRRTPRDLGISFSKANPIMVVIAYELYGFDDRSIVEVTGLNNGQLNEIRSVPQYEEIKTVILEAVANNNKDKVLNELEKHSMRAVEVYVDALNAPRHNISMAAADRVLNTLGYTQQAANNKKPSTAEGLTIIINTDRDSNTRIEGVPNGRDH